MCIRDRLGMHGTAYANFAVTECDLLIAIGARFDDRVTGNLDTFAPNAKVIHIDIDPAEVNKNRRVDVAIVSDVLKAVHKINEQSLNSKFTCQTKNWLEKIDFWKNKHPLYDPPKEGENLSSRGSFKSEGTFTRSLCNYRCWTTSDVGCSIP